MFGESLDNAMLLLLLPLSVLPLFVIIAATTAQTTTLSISPEGEASFHETYLSGPECWRGRAVEIGNVQIRQEDMAAETGAYLLFRIGDRRNGRIAFKSDASALVAAKMLNVTLGHSDEPILTDDLPFPTTRRDMPKSVDDLRKS